MQEYLQALKLSLLNIGFDSLDNKWDFDNVISPFSRMYYITSGTAKVYHNNRVFILRPGHMYLIPSYTYSRYKCNEHHQQYYISFLETIGNQLSIYSLQHFNYEIKATDNDLKYFKRLLDLNPNRTLINNNPEVYDQQPILEQYDKKNEALPTKHYLENHGILLILLARFLKKNTPHEQHMTQGKLDKVVIYILQNLHTSLKIEDLAKYCHLSNDHFSRSFNQKIGMRPIKYIQMKRIERAQLLLFTTSDSLLQISEKVGLENVSYFSKIFKRFTGKSPQLYRKEQLNM
ncbi:AraC family transcriptional regulator [Arenibacter sp. F20364]|uniref:AraC family transcriptional regulator n=1 Tax=Arenibacter sp. F20364 TaxID=2926415 RepID=UPI001FF5D116|nr:AraC family transcriptional regulator [Arenibacter sp. F20364]MCK0191869.1 AraC family transcriptional regulator [Arenibacter sp. F20364]